MCKPKFHVTKEISYYPDGRKETKFSIDLGGDYIAYAMDRECAEDLVKSLNFALADSLQEEKEDKNGRGKQD